MYFLARMPPRCTIRMLQGRLAKFCNNNECQLHDLCSNQQGHSSTCHRLWLKTQLANMKCLNDSPGGVVGGLVLVVGGGGGEDTEREVTETVVVVEEETVDDSDTVEEHE